MLRIPRHYGHFVFAVIQSGMTTAIAAAIASVPFLGDSTFMVHWLGSWLIAWTAMAPIVLLAAPVIRRLVHALTTVSELDKGART
jgi:membrane protein implicated in regulation of membrane protease activity